MREGNSVNYLNYCCLLTPLRFLYSVFLGLGSLFYASCLAFCWTCLFYFGDIIDHGVGILDGYTDGPSAIDMISTYLKFWLKVVDKRFLWMIKISVFHMLMVTKFVQLRVWSCMICEMSMFVMVCLSPFRKHLEAWVYWVTMLSEFIKWT